MYLLMSEKGFFVGLSHKAAKAHCRKLSANERDIIQCATWKQAVNFVETFRGPRFLPSEIVLDKVVLWKKRQYVVLTDFSTGQSVRFCNQGTAILTLGTGKRITYKNCPTAILDSKKGVHLLCKMGELLFYDFEQRKVLKMTADKSLYYQNSACSGRWEKVSTTGKVSGS